ncbi:MAG: alcohol dehydrogenase catalytic domain-containing protein [Candidatus Aminicenantes bacterium]|nr:MAG: alcohol dehydrogenase catalytic domain-containing protein [Candidatus Aminicenantes bacterium]
MKAALLTDIRKIEIEDAPFPSIQTDTDVLLRIAAVGLCGSDLQYYSTGRIGSDVVQFPFIIGHECVAEVKEAGRDVHKVKPGDRVVVDPAVSCGTCDQCLDSRPNTCRNLRFLGCPGQMPGSLAEFIVMPESNCYLLDESTSTKLGILAEPLSIGIYSVRLMGDSPISSIAVLGAGPIGLSVGLAAKDTGIQKIYMTDKIDGRLEAAQKAGAAWTGNPDRLDIVTNILEIESSGLDAVFECCGDQEALDQAVELLKPGGKLMIVGIPDIDLATFDVHKLRRKELTIQNVRRQNDCIAAAVDLISRRAQDLDFMVTHSFRLEEAQEAFDLVENYRDGVIKAIIHP